MNQFKNFGSKPIKILEIPESCQQKLKSCGPLVMDLFAKRIITPPKIILNIEYLPHNLNLTQASSIVNSSNLILHHIFLLYGIFNSHIITKQSYNFYECI